MSIDTTPSGAASNSYITVSESNTIFDDDLFFSEIWSAVEERAKERWLIQSCRALERFADFKGAKKVSTQKLEFPRDFESELSDRVKEAQAEMLMFLYAQKTAAAPLDGKEIQSVAALNGTVDITYSGKRDLAMENAGGSSLASVRALLRPYLQPIRLERR